MEKGIMMQNNAGLVTGTAVATGDLVHTLSLGRHAYLRKVMWSNNTGGNGTLIFGTQDAQAVPAFVALFPTITCLNGFDGELTEAELPDIKFILNRAALAAGRSGNIYVLTSVAGILVACTIEEIG
jgi:hypothetical protein